MHILSDIIPNCLVYRSVLLAASQTLQSRAVMDQVAMIERPGVNGISIGRCVKPDGIDEVCHDKKVCPTHRAATSNAYNQHKCLGDFTQEAFKICGGRPVLSATAFLSFDFGLKQNFPFFLHQALPDR